MSKPKSKEEIKAHKDESISNLSDFLNKLIESEIPSDSKRADLISYWLKDFQQYISQEKSFDASKIKSYKRGDVVKVNLGFNVGSEQGGLRYAIILDKVNKHNANTVTVVPLSSQKNTKKIYERDVDLGCELYNRLKSKYDSSLNELIKERTTYQENLQKAHILHEALLKTNANEKENETLKQAILQAEEMIDAACEAISILSEEENNLKKIKSELHKMKDGSIAKIEQITTISKQRIFDPKGNKDVLSGIHFSDSAMDKINEKLKELYIF